jgi:phosphatidylethanolamine/phosphatidyl-N-methylethanolamine N-methyltransferase
MNLDEGKAVVADFYERFYTNIFNSSGISKFGFDFTHKVVEKTFKTRLPENATILEIGAGKGEHFSYVKHDFSHYLMLDLFAPPEDFPGSKDPRVDWMQCDISVTQFQEDTFDRVISMCVLHHLDDPLAALSVIQRAIKPGGVFSLFLPSDPGLMTRINRNLTVKKRSQKLGFEKYDLMAALEHKNHYWGLSTLLHETFAGWNFKKRYYPFGIKSGNLSLFSVWHLTKPTKKN